MKISYRVVSVSSVGRVIRAVELRAPGGYASGPAPAWRPPTDVCEMDDHYLVQIEVAGLDLESIEIAFADDALTVVGQRGAMHPAGEIRCVERSIPSGRFAVHVRLPGAIAPDGAAMRYRAGFLVTQLPKRVSGWA